MSGRSKALRWTYEEETDAAYLYLVEIGWGEAVKARGCNMPRKGTAVTLSFDEDDRLLGIEVLGASRALTEAGFEALKASAMADAEQTRVARRLSDLEGSPWTATRKPDIER